MNETRVLIVEDEAIVAQDIANQLQRLGYQVDEIVFSGEEALMQVEQSQPDLVLMDIHLRGALDGIETAEKIRARYDIPVIYMTAYSDDETLGRARVTEPFGYLLKPFVLREMHSVIEMALYKHQMELQLKRSEAKFRTLAETNPTLTLIVQLSGHDAAWRLVYANPTVEKITGYSPQLLEIVSQFDLVESAYHHQFQEALYAAQSSPDQPHEFEIEIITRTRQIRWLDCVLNSIEYDDENMVLITAFDITERKNAEQQRLELVTERERNKMFQHLLNDTAHDLRTPLTAISMSSHLLQNLPKDSLKFEHYLEVIETQAKHLEYLLDNMFQLARLDVAQTLDVQPVEITRLVQKTLASHALAFQAKKHNIKTDYAPDVSIVLANDMHLSRVIANILTNAFNYTPEGGTILVRIKTKNQYVAIEISDSGIGIGPADLPHIFERFYRADKARNSASGGSGLGLAIAQKIVRMHGGTIEVESMLGEGSTFRILLPIEYDNGVATSQSELTQHDPGSYPSHISAFNM